MIHNEVERIQTSLYNKAGVTPYYVAEDKESVFIALSFILHKTSTQFLCSFHKSQKYAKKVLQLRYDRSTMRVQVKER